MVEKLRLTSMLDLIIFHSRSLFSSQVLNSTTVKYEIASKGSVPSISF